MISLHLLIIFFIVTRYDSDDLGLFMHLNGTKTPHFPINYLDKCYSALKPKWYEVEKTVKKAAEIFAGLAVLTFAATACAALYFSVIPPTLVKTALVCVTFFASSVFLFRKDQFWNDPAYRIKKTEEIAQDVTTNQLNFSDVKEKYGVEIEHYSLLSLIDILSLCRYGFVEEQLKAEQIDVLKEDFIVYDQLIPLHVIPEGIQALGMTECEYLKQRWKLREFTEIFAESKEKELFIKALNDKKLAASEWEEKAITEIDKLPPDVLGALLDLKILHAGTAIEGSFLITYFQEEIGVCDKLETLFARFREFLFEHRLIDLKFAPLYKLVIAFLHDNVEAILDKTMEKSETYKLLIKWELIPEHIRTLLKLAVNANDTENLMYNTNRKSAISTFKIKEGGIRSDFETERTSLIDASNTSELSSQRPETSRDERLAKHRETHEAELREIDVGHRERCQGIKTKLEEGLDNKSTVDFPNTLIAADHFTPQKKAARNGKK